MISDAKRNETSGRLIHVSGMTRHSVENREVEAGALPHGMRHFSKSDLAPFQEIGYMFFRNVNYVSELSDRNFGDALPFVRYERSPCTDLIFHLSGSNKEANKGYSGVHQQSDDVPEPWPSRISTTVPRFESLSPREP